MEQRTGLVTVHIIALVVTIVAYLFDVWLELAFKKENQELNKVSDTTVTIVVIVYFGTMALAILIDAWILSVCKSWVAEGKRLLEEYPQEP
jgi:hypothetical protein